MNRALKVTFILLISFAEICAQEKKPVATVAQDRKSVEIRYPSGEPIDPSFAPSVGDLKHYRLVELEPLDEPGVVTSDRTQWIDSNRVPECLGGACDALLIRLNRELPSSQTFILAISDFTKFGKATTLRFETADPAAVAALNTAQIISGPDVYKQNSQLQIISKEDIRVASTVEVHRVYYEVESDGISIHKKSDIFVAQVIPLNNRRYILQLNGKLVAGKEHVFYIDDQITNSLGDAIKAEGIVKIAGIPTKPDEIRLETNWSSIAAVHQKPVFEMTGKYNPIRIEQLGGTEWLWEPVLNVDVGLRSTKSANSVVLAPLNFSNIFLENSFKRGTHKLPPPKLGLPNDKAEEPGRSYNYADWLSTPWYRPSNVKFTIGPKAEFDRNFKRKNVLGGLRFDLNFFRWHASIADRRALIEDDFGKEASANVRLNYGFKIIPFLAFDFGGHVNNETVKKKVKGQEVSVLVPRHKIFRSYVGFVSSFEINRLPTPITITIEEWMVHIAARELIGFTTDDGAFLKPMHGFHHRGKATFAFALDPSKHYNLTLTYENGRLAPNFEYLNKVTTGIKVVY